MLIKVIIVVLFVALVISLFSGLAFLAKDMGATRRTWYALGVRLVLVALLMATVIYGLQTGELRSNAPWDILKAQQMQQQQLEQQKEAAPK